MITANEILMGRDVAEPLTKEMFYNLLNLLPKINYIRFLYGKPLHVSSGYRPPSINASVGGSKKSAHLLCMAVDFKDPDGSFALWCLNNLPALKKVGLYMEDPRWTMKKTNAGYAGWVHLDTRKRSNQVFIPYDPAKKPPTAPNFC